MSEFEEELKRKNSAAFDEMYWNHRGGRRESHPDELEQFIKTNISDIAYIENFMPFSDPPKLEKSSNLNERVFSLESKVSYLQKQIRSLKTEKPQSYLETQWRRIVQDIADISTSINSVESVYSTRNNNKCNLIFVYTGQDVVKVTETILKQTNVLEDKYPKVIFNYLILNESEITSHDKETSFLLYSR